MTTHSHNLANSSLIFRRRSKDFLDRTKLHDISKNCINFNNHREVLHDRKLALDCVKEVMDVAILLHEAERFAKTEMGDNVHGEVLDSPTDIKQLGLAILGYPFLLNSLHEVRDPFVDYCFSTQNLLAGVLLKSEKEATDKNTIGGSLHRPTSDAVNDCASLCLFPRRC
jgi:hypothetical protein